LPITVVTWNVHGSGGLDVEAVAGHLDDTGADLVGLQEVQRAQAVAIADRIGVRDLAWCFKHRGSLRPAEGLAVLFRGRSLDVSCQALTARWRWWSWRRRIVQVGGIEVDGRPVVVVHTHLTPHPAGGPRRLHEAGLLRARLADAGTGARIVAGDLNEGPADPALSLLRHAGLQDAWEVATERSGEGSTNWSRAGATAPDQRIDYILCGPEMRVHRASVPDPGAPGRRWRALSDHLPLTVTLSVRGAPGT
jgi:endonuclease/exonuclease/phosphatase family metal-dependent hydrolase